MEKLDAKLAYRAMFHFLEKYYELTNADDVGALLGSMQMLQDGRPIDSAMWDEWLAAIDNVLAEKNAESQRVDTMN